MPLEAELLVSDAVDEVMLGIDWLTEPICHWKFAEWAIVIAGRQIALQSRPSRALIRRIYVEEPVILSPRSITDIPVRMTWNSFRAPATEWLLEPRQFGTGVYVARTMLPERDPCGRAGNQCVTLFLPVRRRCLFGWSKPGISSRPWILVGTESGQPDLCGPWSRSSLRVWAGSRPATLARRPATLVWRPATRAGHSR